MQLDSIDATLTERGLGYIIREDTVDMYMGVKAKRDA